MQPISEKWEVKVGKDIFILNGVEVNEIKKAQRMGSTMIWFKDFCIGINFIISMKLLNPEKKETLPVLDLPERTPEQLATARKRIAEIRNKYGKN